MKATHKIVYKFLLPIGGVCSLPFGNDARPIHADMQQGVLQLWVEVPYEEPRQDFAVSFVGQKPFVSRTFEVFGTGYVIPENFKYVATVLDGSYVWHIYEH